MRTGLIICQNMVTIGSPVSEMWGVKIENLTLTLDLDFDPLGHVLMSGPIICQNLGTNGPPVPKIWGWDTQTNTHTHRQTHTHTEGVTTIPRPPLRGAR